MKIAFIVRRFAFEEWGGTEHVVMQSALALMRCGHTVDILCTAACSRVGTEVRDGISIFRFPYFYPRFPMPPALKARLDKKGGDPFAPALIKKLKSGDYDLIHAHTLGHLAARAQRVAKEEHIPFIVSLHGGQIDVPAAEQQQLHTIGGKTFHYGRLMDMAARVPKNVVDVCDGLICVGKGEYEAQKQRYPAKKIIYLPNAVDAERFEAPLKIDLRGDLTIAKTDRVLLCVSRIDPQKNQMALVQAFAKMHENRKDTTLLLIGPVTDQAYLEQIKAFALERNLHQLKIIPGLEHDDERLRSAYLQSDVFILPSRHEPFGIVILEAWSARLPVIAARVGGIPGLVDDGRTGCLYDTQEELENILISQFACDMKWGEKYIEPAYVSVRETYSIQAVCEQCTAFYSEVSREL